MGVDMNIGLSTVINFGWDRRNQEARAGVQKSRKSKMMADKEHPTLVRARKEAQEVIDHKAFINTFQEDIPTDVRDKLDEPKVVTEKHSEITEKRRFGLLPYTDTYEWETKTYFCPEHPDVELKTESVPDYTSRYFTLYTNYYWDGCGYRYWEVSGNRA